MRAFLLAGLLIALGLVLQACDSADPAAGEARLTVRLTDDPFPFDLADAAVITITRVELLAGDRSVSDDDTTGLDEVLDRIVLFDGDPVELNLLDLRDGVDTLLVNRFSVPSDGSYNKLRFFVGEDAEVRFADGSVYDLKLPSAQQSGIKVTLPDYDFDTTDGEIDVLVDFDVEKSFVTRGNPAAPGFQGFLFRPVLEVEAFDVVAVDDGNDDGSTETDDQGESAEV